MSNRHVLSQEDLEEYYNRISFPKAKRIFHVSDLSDADKLAFLDLLQKHELCKVPWENLTQHYSWHHVINVKPLHLFKKIVRQPGRGGFCMEANLFFHLVLVNLGFDTYMAGSRIWHADEDCYGGWTHVINIVRIAGVKYLIDGGYGGAGPSGPVPLEHDVATVQIAPGQTRLLYQPIRQLRDQSQKVWIYEHRFSPESHWTPHYCFVDCEFVPEDIVGMSLEPGTNRHTWFTHKVVAVRFTTDRESSDGPGSPSEAALEGKLDGAIALNNDWMKWRRNGKKILHLTFQSEAERLAALKKYFGITFAPEDAEGIKGTAAEIGAKAIATG